MAGWLKTLAALAKNPAKLLASGYLTPSAELLWLLNVCGTLTYHIHSGEVPKYIKYKQIYQNFYKENRTYLSYWEQFFCVLSASFSDNATDRRQFLGDSTNLRQSLVIPVGNHRREVMWALCIPFLALFCTIFITFLTSYIFVVLNLC